VKRSGVLALAAGRSVKDSSLYVFVRGKWTDPYLLGEEIQKLKNKFRHGAAGEFEVGSYDSESDPATILDDLFSRRMFSPSRLIIVEGADDFVANHLESIEKFVKNPSSGNCLALVVSRLDRRSSFGRLAQEAGRIILASRPKGVNLHKEALSWARKRGKSLERAAAEALIERTGESLSLIESEVEKLCLCTGDKKIISREDVEALVGRNPDFDVFDLFGACGEANSRLAHLILERLFSAGFDSPAITGAIASQIRRLIEARLLVDSGASLRTAMRKVNIPPSHWSKNGRLLERFSFEELVRFRKWLLQMDLASKTGQMPERLALEIFVARLCIAKDKEIATLPPR